MTGDGAQAGGAGDRGEAAPRRGLRVLGPSLQGYRRAWLSRDLVAGLTVWAVLVPEALAYATTLDVYNNGLIGPGHCSEQG